MVGNSNVAQLLPPSVSVGVSHSLSCMEWLSINSSLLVLSNFPLTLAGHTHSLPIARYGTCCFSFHLGRFYFDSFPKRKFILILPGFSVSTHHLHHGELYRNLALVSDLGTHVIGKLLKQAYGILGHEQGDQDHALTHAQQCHVLVLCLQYLFAIEFN
jgi:hypothetical protein